jgi:hypothetical protein
MPMLKRAAKLCAEVTLLRGYRTQAALLSPAQLRARSSGLTCHRDLSSTFSGTHTDPGPNFPWDVLFAELRKELAGIADEQLRQQVVKNVPVSAPAGNEGDSGMAVSDADFAALVAKVDRLNKQSDRTDDILGGHGTSYPDSNLAKQLGYVVSALGAKVDALTAKVDALSKQS